MRNNFLLSRTNHSDTLHTRLIPTHTLCSLRGISSHNTLPNFHPCSSHNVLSFRHISSTHGILMRILSSRFHSSKSHLCTLGIHPKQCHNFCIRLHSFSRSHPPKIRRHIAGTVPFFHHTPSLTCNSPSTPHRHVPSRNNLYYTFHIRPISYRRLCSLAGSRFHIVGPSSFPHTAHSNLTFRRNHSLLHNEESILSSCHFLHKSHCRTLHITQSSCHKPCTFRHNFSRSALPTFQPCSSHNVQ